MSKYLTLFCILGVVALFVVPAYAEVQNVKVGGDITIRGISRNDYDLQQKNLGTGAAGETTSAADDGSWFMTTTRLRVDADLTDNVSTTIRLLNERDWDTEDATTTDVDLDLASITLKELFYSPLSATLGRQEIVLGDGLILANPYPDPRNVPANAIVADDLSARRAFDAIRAILDYDPWTINLIAVKLDETLNTGVDNDDDLYVANVGYKFGQYNAEAEGYLAFKRDQGKNLQLTTYSDGAITERRTFEDANIYTLGLRTSLEPTERLTLKGEIAYQFGELIDQAISSGDYNADSSTKDTDIKAWAADVAATYAIDYTWSPKLGVKYALRSGEGNSWSGDYESWDALYEGQVNGVVLNGLTIGNASFQLNNTNMNIIGVNGSVVPLEDLTLGVDYYHYILDEKLDNATNSAIYTKDDDYGDEVDVSLNYAYTPDVSLGLLYGIFMPGDAFEKTYDDAASEVVGTVKVTF